MVHILLQIFPSSYMNGFAKNLSIIWLLTLKHLHKFDLCRYVDKKNKNHTGYNFPHKKIVLAKMYRSSHFWKILRRHNFLSELFLNPLKYWNIYMNWRIQNDMSLYTQLKRVFHYEIDKAIFTKLYNYKSWKIYC